MKNASIYMFTSIYGYCTSIYGDTVTINGSDSTINGRGEDLLLPALLRVLEALGHRVVPHPVTGREGGREREGGRGREREREGEGGRGREREGGRGRERGEGRGKEGDAPFMVHYHDLSAKSR